MTTKLCKACAALIGDPLFWREQLSERQHVLLAKPKLSKAERVELQELNDVIDAIASPLLSRRDQEAMDLIHRAAERLAYPARTLRATPDGEYIDEGAAGVWSNVGATPFKPTHKDWASFTEEIHRAAEGTPYRLPRPDGDE